MVFSRLFGKGDAAQKKDEPPVDDAEDAPVVDDEEETPPGDEPVTDWSTRASRVLVGGASTGSKRPTALLGEPRDATLPTHFVQAAGCHVITADGDTLLDCTMALGSVALGYSEPELTRAVIETLANGSVSGLSSTLEVEVAERFCGLVPCAERVQWVKTGAEAMSATVRIARAYTGRDVVIGAGYFGWHDWSSDTAGVPAATKQLFRAVPFDDVAALEAAVAAAQKNVAAIVIEPVVEKLPSKEWVARARSLCDEIGAVLIFDEMKTGFRLATGGYQQYADVTPDLAAFGKAMANGYPLAAVCGNADLMQVAERSWISSTLAGEAGSLAAANAVFSWHERVDVCGSLWSIGKDMREVVQSAMVASGIAGVAMVGIDPMWFLRFDDPSDEATFLRAGIHKGVLFKRGAYNYAALAHDDDAIRQIEAAASAAFVEVREASR